MHTCNDDEPKLAGRWNEYGVNDDEDDEYDDVDADDVDDGSGDGHRSLAGSPKCPTNALIKVTAAALLQGRSRESHLSSRLSRESTRAAQIVLAEWTWVIAQMAPWRFTSSLTLTTSREGKREKIKEGIK